MNPFVIILLEICLKIIGPFCFYSIVIDYEYYLLSVSNRTNVLDKYIDIF